MRTTRWRSNIEPNLFVHGYHDFVAGFQYDEWDEQSKKHYNTEASSVESESDGDSTQSSENVVVEEYLMSFPMRPTYYKFPSIRKSREFNFHYVNQDHATIRFQIF